MSVSNVKLFIGNSEDEEELQFRYYREVNNPEAYDGFNIGEKMVVNGMNNPERIVGTIADIVNDPDHGSRHIFVQLSHDDFNTAVDSGTWTLI